MAQPRQIDKTLYSPEANSFYAHHAHQMLYLLMIVLCLSIAMTSYVLYQTTHRPLPVFYAIDPNQQKMHLTPFYEPNLLPDTILSWASKGATLSYNFDYVHYEDQLALARPYFTEAGWTAYIRSVSGLINTIVAKQIFVNGVVAGTPVISNQGPLPGSGYTWRVQIPFLVTYQSANVPSQRSYYVVLTLVRVPTTINPQGIGIDQFVMVPR